MKYICTLIAVSDMEKSKKFYQDILNQKVIEDLGANVTLSGGFALQTTATWKDFIKADSIEKGNNSELVFEEEDIERFLQKLEAYGVDLVHPLFTQPWGQRVIHFYDPDQHIIEVGEEMKFVVQRFINNGMTLIETAEHMQVSLDYVIELTKDTSMP